MKPGISGSRARANGAMAVTITAEPSASPRAIRRSRALAFAPAMKAAACTAAGAVSLAVSGDVPMAGPSPGIT